MVIRKLIWLRKPY